MTHTQRTRFGDIACEFLPPARHGSPRAVILCDGFPAVPSKKHVMEFFAKKNFWVFHPRYRGSWESSGTFLEHSPHEDLLTVIDSLEKGWRDLWSGENYNPALTHLTIIGVSFGGAAALLASLDPRVKKVVALSPVVDWKQKSKKEPLPFLEKFTRDAFGEGYRIAPDGFQKLQDGTFFNPTLRAHEMEGKKILIFHAKDDEIVPPTSVVKFAQKTSAQLKLYPRGGHLSSTELLTPRMWKVVKKFLAKK